MPATDKFSSQSVGQNSPAEEGFVITPSNTVELDQITRGIYVGVGGDITLALKLGGDLLFKNVVAGSVLPIRAKFIKATGTTASDLIGLV